MLEGSRKLIAFVALMIVIAVLVIYGGPDADDDIESLIYLFMLFIGGNIGEHGIKTYRQIKQG